MQDGDHGHTCRNTIPERETIQTGSAETTGRSTSNNNDNNNNIWVRNISSTPPN